MQLDLGRAAAQPIAQGERWRLTTGGHTAHLPEGALAVAPQVNAGAVDLKLEDPTATQQAPQGIEGPATDSASIVDGLSIPGLNRLAPAARPKGRKPR